MFYKEKLALKAEIKELTAKNVDLLQRISALDKEVERIKEAGDKIETERNKLKKMVRQQTEADLLVNAMRGIGIINDDKVVEHDVFSEERRLMSMQRQAGSMNACGYSGLSGLSGLSGFGR